MIDLLKLASEINEEFGKNIVHKLYLDKEDSTKIVCEVFPVNNFTEKLYFYAKGIGKLVVINVIKSYFKAGNELVAAKMHSLQCKINFKQIKETIHHA